MTLTVFRLLYRRGLLTLQVTLREVWCRYYVLR